MKLLAILAALGFEQWRLAGWRDAPEQGYVAYLRWLEVRLSGWGPWLATAAALLPTLLLIVVDIVLAPVWLLMLLWSIVLLYLLMGFRRFSHAVTEITESLQNGDLPMARRILYDWQGGDSLSLSSDEIALRTIEAGVLAGYRCVFGIVFWFVVLGPVGAAFYWMLALQAREWAENVAGEDVNVLSATRAELGRVARWLIFIFDWLPMRLLAFSFAIVGDFEDAIYQWRAQPDDYSAFDNTANENLLLATAAGALGLVWERRAPMADKIMGVATKNSSEPAQTVDVASLEGRDAEADTVAGRALGASDAETDNSLGDPPPSVSATPGALPSAIGMVWRALLFWLGLVLLMTVAYWA